MSFYTLSRTFRILTISGKSVQIGAPPKDEQRQLFDAKGGYLGTRLLVSVSFNATENIRMFIGASTSMHAGTANEDSPLFLEKNTYSIGLGMVWRLWESEEKVSGR